MSLVQALEMCARSRTHEAPRGDSCRFSNSHALTITQLCYTRTNTPQQDATWERIAAARPIDIAIVDSTFIEREIASHLSLVQALEMCASRLHPRKLYLTGMSHEFDYGTLQPLLVENFERQSRGEGALSLLLPQSMREYVLPKVDAEMAYDTMTIPF